MSIEEHRFPCEQCGSDMRFSPPSGQLLCDHCGHSRPMVDDAHAPALRELNFEEALARTIDIATPIGIEPVRFENAANRVLAHDLLARSNAPAMDVSAMDGYGVRGADIGVLPDRRIADVAEVVDLGPFTDG